MQTIWIIDDDAAIGDLEQELLERAASSLGCVYTCGRLSLDTASHTVLAAGEPVSLTRTEYAILKLLLQNPGQVLAKSTLLDRISTDTPDCTERSLKQHVSNLRHKLATHYGFIDSGRIVRELSSDEPESASRKCLQLTVSDTVSLAMALDKLGAEYQILSDTTARVYSPLSVTTLVHTLDTETCELLHVTEQDESLESFYMNLVGGVHHG